MRPHLFALAIAVVIGAACRGDKPPPPPVPPPPAEPVRGAAGDQDLRVLLAQVAERRGCEMMKGQFRALRDPTRPDVVTGVLWIRDCRMQRHGATRLTLELGMNGWQWIEKAQDKAGATFEVAQDVRFAANVTIPGALDVAYAPETHVASLWFSPVKRPAVTFSPIGGIDVENDGAWSATVGALGSVIGMSPESQAEDQAESEGKGQMASQLSHGLGATIDACTGLVRFELGRPAKGKMYPAGLGESTRVSLELRASGFFIGGPYLAPKGMNVTVEVEQGAVRAAIVCRGEAEKIADAFLEGRELPDVKTLVTKDIDKKATLHIGPQRCQVDVMMRSIPDAHGTPARFKWHRATSEWAESAGGALVKC